MPKALVDVDSVVETIEIFISIAPHTAVADRFKGGMDLLLGLLWLRAGHLKFDPLNVVASKVAELSAQWNQRETLCTGIVGWVIGGMPWEQDRRSSEHVAGPLLPFGGSEDRFHPVDPDGTIDENALKEHFVQEPFFEGRSHCHSAQIFQE